MQAMYAPVGLEGTGAYPRVELHPTLLPPATLSVGRGGCVSPEELGAQAGTAAEEWTRRLFLSRCNDFVLADSLFCPMILQPPPSATPIRQKELFRRQPLPLTSPKPNRRTVATWLLHTLAW